mmetsp:Transcript_40693/g.97611  ORF Transcript_40693/g.97611 Transcript_40693/m.97611 type:complete len:208 (-) Transcript_40693:137-760(-)
MSLEGHLILDPLVLESRFLLDLSHQFAELAQRRLCFKIFNLPLRLNELSESIVVEAVKPLLGVVRHKIILDNRFVGAQPKVDQPLKELVLDTLPRDLSQHVPTVSHRGESPGQVLQRHGFAFSSGYLPGRVHDPLTPWIQLGDQGIQKLVVIKTPALHRAVLQDGFKLELGQERPPVAQHVVHLLPGEVACVLLVHFRADPPAMMQV